GASSLRRSAPNTSTFTPTAAEGRQRRNLGGTASSGPGPLSTTTAASPAAGRPKSAAEEEREKTAAAMAAALARREQLAAAAPAPATQASEQPKPSSAPFRLPGEKRAMDSGLSVAIASPNGAQPRATTPNTASQASGAARSWSDKPAVGAAAMGAAGGAAGRNMTPGARAAMVDMMESSNEDDFLPVARQKSTVTPSIVGGGPGHSGSALAGKAGEAAAKQGRPASAA
ncbi:hypothetical protein HaLaN_14140, partial [Haematococcus lacustris]